MNSKRVIAKEQSDELNRLRLIIVRNATSSQSGLHDHIFAIDHVLRGGPTYSCIEDMSTDEIITMVQSTVDKWRLT